MDVPAVGQRPKVRCVPGAPCWVTLTARDLSATEAFYGPLLGWTFKPGPDELGPYTYASVVGTTVAGIAQVARRFELPVVWTTYFGTENADGAADLVRDSGGTVAVGPLRFDGLGRVALAADPQGATFGLWEGQRGPARHLRRSGEPVWSELRTRDAFDAAVFYSQVFSWDTRDPAHYEVRYENDRVVLRVDGHSTAALCGGGNEAAPDPTLRPRWLVYFAVGDVDAAVRLAVRLGGEVTSAPADSPYGRTAGLRDPEGGLFSLNTPPD